MRKHVGLVVGALMGLVAACSAQGTFTVTFGQSAQEAPGTLWGVSSYTESSMLFQPQPGGVGIWLAGQNYPGGPDNGSTSLQEGFGDSLVFSHTDAQQTFSIGSVDLAEFSTASPQPETISFFGYHPDGSMVSVSFTTDGIADGRLGASDFQTFLFGAGWTDLTRVEVPGAENPGQGWYMDNLVFSGASSPSVLAVPEPTIGALFVVGAIAFGLRKKRAA